MFAEEKRRGRRKAMGQKKKVGKEPIRLPFV